MINDSNLNKKKNKNKKNFSLHRIFFLSFFFARPRERKRTAHYGDLYAQRLPPYLSPIVLSETTVAITHPFFGLVISELCQMQTLHKLFMICPHWEMCQKILVVYYINYLSLALVFRLFWVEEQWLMDMRG